MRCYFCTRPIPPGKRCELATCKGQTFAAHSGCYAVDRDGMICHLADVLAAQ